MKKIIVLLVLLLLLVLFFLLLKKITINDIDNLDLQTFENGEIKRLDIEDQNFFDKLNETIADKWYFKKPFYKNYDLNEVEFILNLHFPNEDGVYRILINTDKSGGIGSRSRIDIIEPTFSNEFFNEMGNYTVFLSNEQVEILTKYIEHYLEKLNTE